MKRLILFFLGVATATFGGIVLAAEDASPPPNATAAQFETWVKASRTKQERLKAEPAFSRAVVQRLQDEKFVTDDTILTCAIAWSYYEQAQAIAKGGNEYTFNQTLAFLHEVEPFVPGRQFLEAQLLLKKAYCFTLARQPEPAMAGYQQAAALLETLHLQIDQQRLNCLNELADALFTAGKKSESEKFYLEVLSYPWFNVVKNSEVLQNLRGQYVRAGRGLINCRRGDLKGLKDIFFVPAAVEELTPFLNKAIAEAETKKE